MKLAYPLWISCGITWALLGASMPALAVQGDYMPNADELRETYKDLYDQQVTAAPDGSLRFDRARLFRRGGVNVLSLKGDAFEMAYQHGRLMKDEIAQGVVPASAKLVYNQVNTILGHRPLMRDMVYNVIDRRYYTRMLDHALNAAGPYAETNLQVAFALSEATDIPMNTFIDAVLSPSVMMVLAAGRGEAEGIPTLTPMANCSEVVLRGSRSADGDLLIARNTDYPLNGAFDNFPTVIYFDPTTPGLQKYAIVMSAGAHNAGVTAMNESGLYFGAHTIPTDQVAVEAVPAHFLASGAIATAKTFDEALAILKTHPVESGWAYVLVSAAENRAAVIEANHAGIAVREMQGDMLIQTNEYMTEEKAGENLYINRGIINESRGRYQQLTAMVEDAAAPFDARMAARLLADHTDWFQEREVGIGNTVAVSTTVSSVVAQPRAGRMYVSNGVAPVSHGRYVELPWPGDFDPERFAEMALADFDNSGFVRSSPNRYQGVRAYIEAKMAYEYRDDAAEALQHIERAIALDPDTGAYRIAQAAMAIRTGAYDVAEAAMNEALSRVPLSIHEHHLCLYLRGRLLAHRRAKAEARADFTAIIDDADADEKLKAGATEARRKLNRLRRLKLGQRELVYMMQFADFQKY